MSTIDKVFCFTCESEQRGTTSASGEALCAACNSEFCELIEVCQYDLFYFAASAELDTAPFLQGPRPLSVPVVNNNTHVPSYMIEGQAGSVPRAQLVIIHETIPLGANMRMG